MCPRLHVAQLYRWTDGPFGMDLLYRLLAESTTRSYSIPIYEWLSPSSCGLRQYVFWWVNVIHMFLGTWPRRPRQPMVIPNVIFILSFNKICLTLSSCSDFEEFYLTRNIQIHCACVLAAARLYLDGLSLVFQSCTGFGCVSSPDFPTLDVTLTQVKQRQKI